MVAAGVMRLRGSGPFQQDLKGARIRLGDGVVFKIEGEDDWLADGSSGPGTGEAPDCLDNDGVGPGCTTAHAYTSR
jgi:hypothetical protein